MQAAQDSGHPMRNSEQPILQLTRSLKHSKSAVNKAARFAATCLLLLCIGFRSPMLASLGSMRLQLPMLPYLPTLLAHALARLMASCRLAGQGTQGLFRHRRSGDVSTAQAGCMPHSWKPSSNRQPIPALFQQWLW